MAVEGAIAESAKSTLPITWDALLTDSRYGESLLTAKVDYVKEKLFGEVITVGEEETYSLMVINYAAKLVALEMIPPGIDFWMNQPSSESATGTTEVHTFVDRAEALRKLAERLLQEVRRDEADVLALLNRPRKSARSVPALSTIDDDLLTPSPQDFPRPFTNTGR